MLEGAAEKRPLFRRRCGVIPSSGSRPVRSMCRIWSLAGSCFNSSLQLHQTEDRFHLGAIDAIEVLDDPALEVVVNPSLSQKSRQVALVTRLPDQEWASSWAINETKERSPARIVGVANVNLGFSIPPNGKLGGKHQDVIAAPSIGTEAASRSM